VPHCPTPQINRHGSEVTEYAIAAGAYVCGCITGPDFLSGLNYVWLYDSDAPTREAVFAPSVGRGAAPLVHTPPWGRVSSRCHVTRGAAAVSSTATYGGVVCFCVDRRVRSVCCLCRSSLHSHLRSIRTLVSSFQLVLMVGLCSFRVFIVLIPVFCSSCIRATLCNFLLLYNIHNCVRHWHGFVFSTLS
jgi:hypothetical protein